MFLWFVGTSIATVWFVFRDPGFDHRLLVVGALLPPVVDVWFGGAAVMHAFPTSVALLVVVMLATVGRRRVRRAALGLPLGTMLHLVFDGAWADADVFWWPFSGAELGSEALPIVARGWWDVPLELVGVVLVWWIWRRAGLRDPAARHRFAVSGRLDLAGTPPAR